MRGPAPASHDFTFSNSFVMTFSKSLLAAIGGILLLSGAGLRADVLKFKNGDHVHGAFIKKEGGQIFFRSEQFGDLSVREADASVELTAPPAPLVTETEVALATGKPKSPEKKAGPAPSAAPPKPEGPAVAATGKTTAPAKPGAAPQAGAPAKTTAPAQAGAAAKTGAPAKPAVAPAAAPAAPAAPGGAESKTLIATTVRLGKGFIKWWGGWHGRIAVSASIIRDTADRSLYAVEARVKRTWKHDEVQVEPRYEFRRDNDVTAVDIFKAYGYWRHTFGEDWFSEYRPNFERDRKSSKAIQLQQQFGLGRHILKSKQYRVHAGLAENIFNTWPMDRAKEDTEYSVESLFGEASLQLPWRITVTERGAWYFAVAGDSDPGWQNEFELTKKLSDALSFSFRYEVRFNNPDPRVTDYERARFLLGFNF